MRFVGLNYSKFTTNLQKFRLLAKFGASRTVSTTSTYQVGTQFRTRVPPKTRLFFCAQRVGDIEEGVWDVYGWNGYQGTMNSTDIRRTADGFALIWRQRPIDDYDDEEGD